jgi:lipid-A-disaccharide synthase
MMQLMIVAGERSGDVYGGRLASALKARRSDLDLFGCGGDAMRQGGVDTVVDSHQFAMVGITEVASGLPRANRAFHRLVQEARRRRPKLAILIDSPSLNMRLATRLKRLAIPVLYFVSPQIWAWKKWRLRQLVGRVDKMACIFDFEEPIYRKAGIPAEYVGHPLAETARAHESRDEVFRRLRLDPNAPTVALLPGSREIEITYILPGILEGAALLSRRRRLQLILAAAPTLDAARLEVAVGGNPDLRELVRVVSHATYDALAYSTVAVVASGTATVEAALLERPMVVVYRVSPITAFFARRMVDVPFFSMVNILAGKQVVPELIQSEFTPARLAAEVERLLDHPEVQSEMTKEFDTIKARLGQRGAIERVARIALEMTQNKDKIQRTPLFVNPSG